MLSTATACLLVILCLAYLVMVESSLFRPRPCMDDSKCGVRGKCLRTSDRKFIQGYCVQLKEDECLEKADCSGKAGSSCAVADPERCRQFDECIGKCQLEETTSSSPIPP
ncbi:unnamed protein product, partial [Mesorhabditis spiculigera]